MLRKMTVEEACVFAKAKLEVAPKENYRLRWTAEETPGEALGFIVDWATDLDMAEALVMVKVG